MRKYDYLKVLQGRYAHGWEDLCAAEDTIAGRKEIKGNLKDYRNNEGGEYRVISRREKVVNANDYIEMTTSTTTSVQ